MTRAINLVPGRSRTEESRTAHVEHALVERRDAVGRDALRDEPGPRLARPGLHQDARGDVVEVRERDDVRGRAPSVVHLGEPEPRPVGHQQRAVVGGDLVRVDGARLPASPPLELRRHPPLPVLDEPHHLRDRRPGHLPRRRRHAHDVVAVAVEAGARAHQRARVDGEAEVDGGVRVEPGRAGPALPRLGDQHLERRAPPAVGSAVPRLEVVDVDRVDVDGEVLEPPGAVVGGRERAHRCAGRVGDRVAAPLRRHRHGLRAARELADRVHELRGPGPVGDRVAEPEADHEAAAREGGDLDEQDERARVLLLRGRGREELVLGDHQARREPLDGLGRRRHGVNALDRWNGRKQVLRRQGWRMTTTDERPGVVALIWLLP
jgi:hypothetical protein